MSEITIAHLIEAQAENNPNAIAIVHENIQVTYRELNQRANQLARYLQAQGVGAEVMVGIAIERSVDMLTSVLGVLKAGGAYVPLDPQYPQARLAYMLEDTHTPVLLTHEKHLPALPEHNATVVCLDRDWAQIAQYSLENLTSQTQPHDLAYVIYTSGSTGQPKGVMIEQHAMISYVQAAIACYGIQAQDRVLQFSSLNFDMSVEEIYPCLCQGGTLVLRTEEVLDSPARFCQKSRDWGVTVWILPTAYWHVFMAEFIKNEWQLPENLRLVVIGGERALPERVWQWLHLVGTMPILLNSYGPTETTVVATSCNLSEVLRDTISSRNGISEVPIGHPLANTQIYVLDAEGNRVPVGATGELHIGGESVARGYLNQPDLTAEKFIPNPFCQQTKARLYKTGDLVRLREDGHLEFLGRIDQQVKIQSFRVELGEIESALITCPQVREAVVAVRDEQSDKRLVAYVVTDPELVNPSATLYAYLRERLPSYMLPKAFVRMTALPLTPSDKIDRKALPAPDSWHIDSIDNFIAPRTDTEQKLAQIWAEVINVSPVGASDDFFMLGGHSLIAAQILSRVHQTFGFEIHFRDLLDNPTLQAFASVIEQQRQTAQHSETLRVTPVSRDQTLPASFAQERVAFIEQLAPSMTAYQFQESLHFIGPLDITLLERSLTEIIHRHEIFRTTFPSQHGKLSQVIHPPFEVKLLVMDLRPRPIEQQQAEVIRLRHEFVQQPFDIEKLPLIRWQIVQLSDTEHELFHVEHHMVHDGWSFNIFLRELLGLYRAFNQGEASPFTESPAQFADYAVWQHQWVNTTAAQAQLAYWTRTLHNMPPLLELPYDRPRPPEQQFRGALERMELPLDLCDTLRAFNALEKVTLFMSMFAAFLVLVHRYSRQDDLCIGSGVANRRMHEIENMIGMVVNNIVLRTDMSGHPTFRALLQQVRQVTLAGYAHEDLPFDKVVEALKPERNLSYNPLFQVMFSFHDAQLPDLKQIPGVEVRLHDNVGNQSAKFDLDVVVMPRAEQRLSQTSKANEKSQRTDGITLVWEYDSDLFDAETIRRMMEGYQTVLADAINRPDVPVSELQMLTAVQKRQLLYEWNQTATADAENNLCIQALFEAQVERTPEAIAVTDGQHQLSYRQLNQRANQLAHYLRCLDVKAEVLVGLSIERSLEMLIGIFGILKAGGAYVPLDPTYPLERLRYMLDDSRASVLVTVSQVPEIDTKQPVTRICLDTDWDTIATYSEVNPALNSQAHHLAYVIYTSGSTGEPKGVLIEHAALVNFTQAALNAYHLTANDRMLQFASISFDAAAEEIYPCLSCGARLYLRPTDMLDSVTVFLNYAREWALTVWDLPTAYWHVLSHELLRNGDNHEGQSSKYHQSLPDTLRLIILGGERVLPERVRHWLQQVGSKPTLINSYGPTETTVVATLCELSTDSLLLPGREVPIGRPLPNVQAYVLDVHDHLVPVGVPGELHIGGVGVARGYLNQPALTTEKFIPDPFSTQPDARLYKTGDLVRYRPDGQLEFLARTDSQVKIRGLRIELGEIETALSQHPAVMQAVVVVREDTPGQKRLVAYWVAQTAPDTVSSETLHQYLIPKLPVYMVPSVFMRLDALPITANRKIDLQALPKPEVTEDDDKRVAPRNAIEEQLATLWCAVLGLDAVGIHDNFFALGGDSIISIQMISRAREAGLQFTPKQLFQNQTIAQLAPVVSLENSTQIIAQQGMAKGEVPLTPIQHWFFTQNLPQAHFFNQSALLALPTGVDANWLQDSLNAVLTQHDALRLRFNKVDSQQTPVQSHSNDSVWPFSQITLPAGTVAQHRDFIQTQDLALQKSLNFGQGPIVRAILFSATESVYLLLIAHHLIVDAISWRILLEDLSQAYQQRATQENIHLPAKTSAFQDWSIRLNQYAHSVEILAELDYWTSRDTLKDDISLDNTLDSIAYVTRSLDATNTRALLQEVPAAYNTQINDVLLTALLQSMQQWTGQTTLQVDLEGHGREDLFADMDISRTVGWFTAMYPVQLQLPDGNDPSDALKAVKEQLRQVPNRGIGYGLLRYLNTDPKVQSRMAQQPPAPVIFNYLGQFDAVTSASGQFAEMLEWKSDHSLQGQRSHLLAISGLVSDDKLVMRWEYSQNLHTAATIEALADGYMNALRRLIQHCQDPETGNYTPSDFSAQNLSQKKLDKLMSKLKKRG